MHHKTEWIELAIFVSIDRSDAVANFLIEQGCSGIVEEGFRSLKDSVVLKAYVKDDGQLKTLLRSIETYLKSLHDLEGTQPYPQEITINQIVDEDWNKKWKSFFQPIKVTDRIVIKPSWRRYWKKQNEIVLELDPGMAFGTGTHSSTRMCLKAIEDLIETFHNTEDTSLLDVGTGSGILSIAAALLGIKKVVGIDIDYQAVACAKKNAKNNSVSEYISFSTIPLKKIQGTFSLIVANILPHVLINMKEGLTSRLDNDGFLILSGILNEKAEEVTIQFSKSLRFIKAINEEEWMCIIFQKINPETGIRVAARQKHSYSKD
jgi:ribosomal protein L11 methyltransferase